MTIIAINTTRVECLDRGCIHAFHDVDIKDPEDIAFHETDVVDSVETVHGTHPGYSVRVSRFDNEDEWRVDVEVRKSLSAPEALALADAIRLQAGVANALTEGMHNGQY